jgi:PQQ-like domain
MRGMYTMIQRMLPIFLLALCPLGSALAEDWPQWQGPYRSSISKETGLLKSWPKGGAKLLWIFRDADVGYSSMAVMGDRLYSMGQRDEREYVFAVDLNNRKKLWSTEIGACNCSLNSIKQGNYTGSRGTPAIDGEFLYVVGQQGNLVCINTTSGKKVWSQEMGRKPDGLVGRYGYCESPLVDGDFVIATPGGKKGSLGAFDKKTGVLKWRSSGCAYATAYSSIIAIESGGVRQYVQSPGFEASDAVVGVRASDGKLLWKVPFRWAVSTPIYQNNCVYVSCMNGCQLIRLVPDGDQFKTESIYANRQMANHLGSSVLVGDHLYGYHGDSGSRGRLKCQDFKTGKIAWSAREGGGSGTILFADGNLYCYDEREPLGGVRLVKATPAGYEERGNFRIPERSKFERETVASTTCTLPALANGKLYLRDQELIFCYDIRNPR